MDDYSHKLYLADFLRRSVIRTAIRALEIPPGGLGLDAGCGIGGPALLLAEAVAPDGHVTGLDNSPGCLSCAEAMAGESSLGGLVSFVEGDVNDITFDDDTFDWVWSSDCVGYPTATRPVRLISELARVVKAGGLVAFLGWTYQQLLPGYPQLEARLNTASAMVAPFLGGAKPESHFLRALDWFREAGLEKARAQTFAGDVRAPLTDDEKSALLSLFDMLWEKSNAAVTTEEQALYQRLTLPDSPDFILDIPGYYAFFTYTMFYGRVAE